MTKNQVRKIRLARGLNQVEFWNVLGVSKTAVCNWERGAKEPSPDSIKKIIQYCEQNNIKY